ncbi:MAG: hypothetical protein WC757_03825 [Candidatus Paceibacterota bacterium]|jgi:hypothetical protein
MESQIFLLAALNIAYKIACLMSGVSICFFGYRLFSLSHQDTGNITVESKLLNMTLNKAAQGTFFALFGAFVISFTIWKGIDIDINRALAADQTLITHSK